MFEKLCITKSLNDYSSTHDEDKKVDLSNPEVGFKTFENKQTDGPLKPITSSKTKHSGKSFEESFFEEGQSSKEDQGNTI